MKTFKILLVATLIPAFIFPGGRAQERDRIVEKVEVTNVEVSVRVFFKGKAVEGLQKEDFFLFVNSKKRKIHGFYEFKKKIVLREDPNIPEDAAVSVPPRLFLLIFNICDYQPDMEAGLDLFFNSIFRPGDRLMVITSRFFFDDKTVSNPNEERSKLKEVLRLEMAETTKRLDFLARRMKSILRSYKSGIKYTRFANLKTENFIRDYQHLVQEYKSLYLKMDDKRYVQLAQYLKSQKCEKWVLNFYQVGRFFKPRLNSDLRKLLLGTKFLEACRRHLELQEVLSADETLLYQDLSKLFAGTGAAFHTLLLENRSGMQNDLAADLSYAPIISPSYELLKEIAKKTSGTFMHSNNVEDFYRKIASGNDIRYMLTYVPSKGKTGKKREIEVRIKNKNYHIYYDDGKRGTYFRKIMKKRQRKNPKKSTYSVQ